MQERFGFAARALFGACAVPGACLAGGVTLLLGGVCLAEAFVVPCLFGPMAAAVIATERLVCAARSSTTSAGLVWSGVAFGWIAVAAFMLHTPWVNASSLQWLVVILIGSSAICRLWARLVVSPFEPTPGAIWVVAAGVIAELATLFGATAAPLARVAAAVALELILIGVLRLLEVNGSRRDARTPAQRAEPHPDLTANLAAGMAKLEPAPA